MPQPQVRADLPSGSLTEAALGPRLRVPPLRSGHVPRSALVERLRSAPERIVTLSAPAGYGKTTLASEWSEADHRPFVWVTVDESDSDPARLVAAVLTGLRLVAPIDPELLPPPHSEEPQFSTSVLPRLAAIVASMPVPFVLVLDDAHELTGPGAERVLQVICAAGAADCRLALLTRGPVPFRRSRARVHGDLLELGADQLAMDAHEADLLLRAAGVEVSAAEVAQVVDVTEGWPVGIYLAARSRAEVSPTGRAHGGFGGADRLVAEYLHDEVLSGADPETLAFMRETSVLNEMCGPLCDAVTARPGSGAVLQRLERSNLLVVPLDRQERWYRYHHLLREQLRTELGRQAPQQVVELQSRASAWFEREGSIDLAVAHALAAEDIDRAGELLWSGAGLALGSGRSDLLRRWRTHLSDQQISRSPRLCVVVSWLCAYDGDIDALQRWTAMAELRARQTRDQAQVPSLLLLRSLSGAHGLEQMRLDAAKAARLLPPDDEWQTLALYLEGAALVMQGDADSGKRELRRCVSLAKALGVHQLEALALTELGLPAVLGGDAATGRPFIEQARQLVDDHQLAEIATSAPVVAASALAWAESGNASRASRELAHASRLTALITGIAPWFAVQGRVVLARTNLLLGQVQEANQWLDEAEDLASGVADSPALTALLDRARSLVRSAEPSGATQPLTTAELRVLQFLPTHLTFPEIGEQLHLSRHTVKSQALSAYRKLGVTSRGDAVATATERGLLPRGAVATV